MRDPMEFDDSDDGFDTEVEYLNSLYSNRFIRTTAGRSVAWGKDIENQEKPTPLIDGVLDLLSTGFLYGRSGTYKSFIAQDMGLCVAHGLQWKGHKVTQGTVLYFVGEGYYWMKQRHIAWRTKHGLNTDPPIAYVNGVPNLLTAAGREEVLAFSLSTSPKFVIIDTLARAFPSGEENSSTVMSLAVDFLQQIVDQTNGFALCIHHAGKDEDKGMRGHSSLPAGVDTILKVGRTKQPGIVEVYSEKQKNHPDGEQVALLRAIKIADSLYLEATSGYDVLRLQLRDYLLANPDANAGDIKQALGGKAETVVALVRQCVEEGDISVLRDRNANLHRWTGA